MENKTCKQCNSEFVITDEDMEFLNKVSPTIGENKYLISPPTLCSGCRQVRRLSTINYKKLYSRKCDKSGENIISCFSPDSPFKVWKNDLWWQDDWDATEFGRDFDFSRPFFEQFHELSLEVPRMHIFIYMNENSDFTNGVTAAKNSYMVMNASYVDNCYYGFRLVNCKDSIDCFSTYKSEKCYECTNVEGCYSCFFSNDLENCSECYISRDCRGCKNCIGCANLSNKQYWIYNQSSTKEEFEKERDRILALSFEEREKFTAETREKLEQEPYKYANITKCENSSGNYLTNCKNAQNSYHASESQDLKNCFDMYQAKDAMDYDLWGAFAERIYECAEVGERATNIAFCDHVYENVSNIYYSMGVFQGSKNCFGCAYLRRKEYCILNKQYTKEQYEELVPRIIEHMKKTGEWGEFFPPALSMFYYNESIVMDYYPKSKEEVEKIGGRWQNEDFTPEIGSEIYEPKDILQYDPNVNPNCDGEINTALAGILKCQKTSKPYRLQAKELAFYIENHIQIPKYHPEYRYGERVARTNRLALYKQQCDCDLDGHEHTGRCTIGFETTHSPEKNRKVFCEQCYQNSIK